MKSSMQIPEHVYFVWKSTDLHAIQWGHVGSIPSRLEKKENSSDTVQEEETVTIFMSLSSSLSPSPIHTHTYKHL